MDQSLLSDLSRSFIEVIPRSMWSIRYDMRAAKGSDLSVPQFRTLALLWRGRRANGELAEQIGVSVPAMSRMVDGLASTGYIDRFPQAHDRRIVLLGLTRRGRSAFRRIREQTQDSFMERFAVLDPQRRQKLMEGLQVLGDLFPCIAAVLLFSASAMAAVPPPKTPEFNPEKIRGALPAESHSTADVVAASAVSKEAPRSAMKLDLKSAVDVALSRNPVVRGFREKVAEAEPGPAISLSTSLPLLVLSGRATYRKDPLSTGNPLFGGEAYNLYQAGLDFKQSVFSGGSLLPGYRAAQMEQQLRAFDLMRSERDLSLQVLQAYYSVLLAQRKLQSLTRNLEVQDDLLKLTRHRQAIGRSQRLDVLQIETQRAQLLPQIEQAKNAVRTGASNLALLLGEKEATEFRLPDVLLPLDVAPLLSASQIHEPLPELRQAQLTRDQFEEQRSVTLSKYYPSLDIVGAWHRQAYVKTDLLDQDSTSWEMGLLVTIPISAPLVSIYERRQLAAHAAILEVSQAETINARSLSEITAREALGVARSNLAAYQQAYHLAGESLAEARRTYRLATIDYLQFLTTEASFFQVEIAYEQSKYDTIDAAARYCVAAGIPLKQLFEILGVKKS
jgi:outer membrane protein TolC/DNA-binding MarR family transcriptional regulator